MCKLDILGLKTLDVVDKCIKAVDPELTVNDMYNEIEKHLSDPEIFDQVRKKKTDGLFQIESDLFKGLADQMQAENILDVCAMLAIGRPGPLSAGMHTAYANRKKGLEEALEQLRGTSHITEDTFNTIIYQEQCMLIAKHVAKFNDAQSDSIIRKALAKKRPEMMDLARRSFIYGKLNIQDPDPNSENPDRPYYDPGCKYGDEILGGVNNGYNEQELKVFWDKLKGYSSYLFNKSHSASYAVITLITMLLKKSYPSKFYAALLSMQSTAQKIDAYVKIARKEGIKVLAPDANNSGIEFTEKNGEILYGLRSIKGIGESALPAIINNRPYISAVDMATRECEPEFDSKGKKKKPKKQFNKKTIQGLIKAGAFDFEDPNRYALLNATIQARKDKDELFSPHLYNAVECMNLESEVLGTYITHLPWFDSIEDGEIFYEEEFDLIQNSTKRDKKGNTMCYAKLSKNGQEISCLVFASIYCKNVMAFDNRYTGKVAITGTKDKDKIIVKKVCYTVDKTPDQEIDIMDIYV